VLSEIGSHLGPTSTSNLTYDEGVRYDGIVTYTWSSGCQYTEAITYTDYQDGLDWYYNITFPNGAVVTRSDSYGSVMNVANVTNDDQSTTTYYAVTGRIDETVNVEANQNVDYITIEGGSWISRVACTPTLDWEVSSCTWKNGSMSNCVSAPGANTTVLDNVGLDALHYYISGIPLYLFEQQVFTYGLQTLQTALMYDPQATTNPQYRAPTLFDYNNMYGLIAQSIASVSTSGYYGAATVPAHGSAPVPAYLVRTYILGIVVTLLILCPVLAISILAWRLMNHVPMRAATFLTIANAVRGPGWDNMFYGDCLMSPDDLRHKHRHQYVKYGVDVSKPDHVGFAVDTVPVNRDVYYSGVNTQQ